MSPRVVLVALTWARDKDPRLPLGHASLLAALDAAPGLDVASLVHAVNERGWDTDALADEIVALAGPEGCVAIGAYVWNEREVQALLPALRHRGHRGRVVLGGPQISYAEPGVAALYPDADVFVRGYAEDALVAVVRAAEGTPIAGVTWRGASDSATQARPELRGLASPWLGGVVPARRGGLVRMETQRGCPFRCSFCQHREAGARLSRHDLDPGRVRDELTFFHRAGVGCIAVLDPIFNAAEHAEAVLDHLRALGFNGRLSLQCRYELVTERFLDACAGLDVVLEFGLQTIHAAESRVIERQNNLARVERAMAWVRQRGIDSEVSLIFGLPEQTRASFRASVDFCLANGIPRVRAFPLMLLRGTPLAQQRERWGLVESADAMPMVVAGSTFDYADWLHMAGLSEALRATEGRHPASVGALDASWRTPEPARWTPAG